MSNQQIGWSRKAKLLWEIQQKLKKAIKVASKT